MQKFTEKILPYATKCQASPLLFKDYAAVHSVQELLRKLFLIDRGEHDSDSPDSPVTTATKWHEHRIY